MNDDSFFSTLENHYNQNLPFVVYSRPINSIVKSWMQKDDVLYTTDSFDESGFVFAPFDLKKARCILLPANNCNHEILEIKDGEKLLINSTLRSSEPINLNKQHHLDLLIEALTEIKERKLDKVVLSRKEERELEGINPIEIFKRLYNTYKNAMVYCWFHPKVGLWLGATPELLFKVVGKQLTTISLAGTQTFKENNEVLWTNKELEEQKIVTNFIENQIRNHTSQTHIEDTETVRAGNLLHLKTRIRSRIKDSSNLKNIINALHPTPAVCGFPKEESKSFILKHENYDRSYYTGFLGELNLKSQKTRNTNKRNIENSVYSSIKTISNFYVNLRCVQIKNDRALIYVGGGITKDSIPEKEWEETVNKTKTIVNILK